MTSRIRSVFRLTPLVALAFLSFSVASFAQEELVLAADSAPAVTAPASVPTGVDAMPDAAIIGTVIQAFAQGNIWLALPLLIFLLVRLVRVFLAPKIAWFGTKIGGVVLAVGTSILATLADTALAATGPITLSLLGGALLKALLYVAAGAMAINSTEKSIRESLTAGKAAADAVATKKDALKVYGG